MKIYLKSRNDFSYENGNVGVVAKEILGYLDKFMKQKVR